MATQTLTPRRFNVDEYLRLSELGIIPERGVELMDGRVVFRGRPWRFTVEDFERLAKEGILTEEERVELIDGEVVEMTPIGSHHAGCLKRIVAALRTRLGDEVILAVRDPLELDGLRQPQPDLMLLRARHDFYRSSHPRPADVLLLIEVADTSRDFDSTGKAEMYARAAIPEYWLVDLTRSEVLIHRAPTGIGYTRVEPRHQGDSWSPHLLPNLTVTWEDIFG